MNTPLIDKHYTIEKMAGKGGWSFVVISEIPATEKGPWVQYFMIGPQIH